MRFQKALFMSNFGIDMGLPEFRVGSYATYLLPFSKVFEKATGGECKFLLGSHTLDLLNRKSKITEINAKNSFVVRGKEYASLFGLGDDFLLESYNDAFGEKEERYIQYFRKLFGDWQPDVIFCWEFPTTLFRGGAGGQLSTDRRLGRAPLGQGHGRCPGRLAGQPHRNGAEP